MSWSLSNHPRVEKVTHKLAKHFSEMEPAPNDRPLKERLVAYLKKQVAEGKFRTCEWACASCAETGKLYRVNGKHTSTLFASLNGHLPEVHVIVERYSCDTLADVASLYSTFDNKASSRTQNDINRIFAASHQELAHLPAQVISRCVAGMSYVEFDKDEPGKARRGTQEERATLMLEYPGFVLAVNDLVHGGQNHKEAKQILLRGPVLAAMFLGWRKSQKACLEFWTSVRDGSGTTPTSPDRKLQKLLLQTAVDNGMGSRTGKRTDTIRGVMVRCIHAWNAWRRGDNTDLKYYPDRPIPSAV